MSHLDPDVAALLALGEQVDEADQAHLDACADCRAEVDAFARAVGAGRAGSADGLLTPPDRVWGSISSELGLSGAESAEPVAPQPAGAESADLVAPQSHVAPRRRAGRRRPVFLVLAAAAAASALIVAGVWIGGGIVPQPTVVSEASLASFPEWPDATGEAVLERVDGHNRVVVTLDAALPDAGYREVWLLASDGSDLVSLGVLDGGGGDFDIPDDVDLARFSVVDISQESVDGDPGHSGDSIVRGTLGES
ncbi:MULTISPECIES: anti-sigma factor domain-containing protein [unclassified Microbacterium]|uniref:anti-sigma factor domain-containing protein n=1 Tax=unclassified Microbacterium TaxID=2609290 RepID=UPI00386BD8EE